MNRRRFLTCTAGLFAAGPAFANGSHTIQVAKTATCGCCAAWVDHIETAGFKTVVEDVEQDALWVLKVELGITQEMSGCHTALVGGYFVEGHVPASDIHRLLADAPDARGLTVPGMPMGSPGMGAEGDFDVLLVLQDGSTQVYSRYS